MTIAHTVLSALAVLVVLASRFAGLYGHQLLALVLVIGIGGGIARRVGWAARRRWSWDRRRLPWLAARASFWAAAGLAAVAVFPRTAEMPVLIAVVGGLAVVRTAMTAIGPARVPAGPSVALAAGAAVILVDLARVFVRPTPVVELHPPSAGEWVVLQGGPSPLVNHHLAAYNQHYALDVAMLVDGRLFAEGVVGAGMVHAWDEPLVAPVDGTVVAARDDLPDHEGAGFVTDPADAAGNHVVIETADHYYVLLGHLREGSVAVRVGQPVRVGAPVGNVGNSGNSSMAHLHLQVQTHADLWDPANRSVPFTFVGSAATPRRNDRLRWPSVR
jgi:hypothetical protein